ncbi:MAG: ChaN family lipoprotein [Gammaproteobacteria bacterium]|nr:ChaN family lipoprotein [Gammaproteobacteria bacterium]
MLNFFSIASIMFFSYSFVAFAEPVAATEDIDKQCVPIGQWKTSKGTSHSNKEILHSLSKTRVVLLGEDHDNPEHHRWQLHTIVELYALEPKLALGFEAFPRSAQKYLDQFVAGELSEKEFLDVVDWDKIWRFNKDFYMPMFHFARMNKIPMYALNVNRSLVSSVSQKGWENIPEKDRDGISDPADASAEYLEMLAGVFAQHMPKHAHKQNADTKKEEPAAPTALNESEIKKILFNPSFRRFAQGQQLWDRAMAEIFYKASKKDKAPLVVGVLGAGHIMGGYGVPHQLDAMGLTNVKTLMAWDGTLECDQLKDGAVDLAFGIGVASDEEKNADDHPRLGVYLENDGGVVVTRIVPGSVSETTGFKVADKITVIAGKPVAKVTDVVRAVKATAFGTWLPMTIVRDDKSFDLVAKFPAKLPTSHSAK